VVAAAPVEVNAGDIVLFHTATWNRYSGDKRYLTEFPGLGASASEWIVQKQIKTFGVDSPTPDNPSSTSYPCHMMCRREHITHYENLANLDQVVNTRFTFVGFPRPHPGGRDRGLRGAVGGQTTRQWVARWSSSTTCRAIVGGWV
jgi:kynurenine formamidase